MRGMSTLESLRRSVSTALVIASRKWRRASHSVLASHNVSEACATPLLVAGRLGEPVRQVVLAEMVSIEGPSLVRLLDQLCAANLVRREEDPDDRRAKIISLTDEGRAVTSKVEAQLVGLRSKVLEGFTRDELETTLRVLSAFHASHAAGSAPPSGAGARKTPADAS
ncbi:Transcriptional regulator, MarR family [Caballeronia glathei]|jgi:MarR family transcriptional regulator for hemolysin|nr:MarR family transcriptional regulator for hemolysin [Paraburkholderia sp. BL8N3]CDY79337.1 Transcriptional regulator, MarR family [Caballeronia glathei]